MKTNRSNHRANLLAILVASCAAIAPLRADDQAFIWNNLVSDIHGVAPFTDENLVNPWGVAPGPHHTVWVANADSGTLTVYNSKGKSLGYAVTVPPAPGSPVDAVGSPTGLVLNHHAFKPNPGDDFMISSGNKSGPSIYLTATEDGTIAGYNATVDETHAIIAVDHSGAGAIYKGLALGWDGAGHHRLYAANFHAGTIEAFDAEFQQIVLPGGFTDPSPVAGYAPFNIHPYATGEDEERTRFLIVAYAKQDADAEDEEAGPGNGYINVFDRDGKFVKRLVPYIPPEAANPLGNHLNAPWGMAIAGRRFGHAEKALLVGNFGDGTIQRFSLVELAGTPLGPLTDRRGHELRFDGLWGLQFNLIHEPGSPDNDSGDTAHELFFAAGIADEEHGLFGQILRR
jgi:uncharacterized protein (TIGR03118 family)